MFRCKGLNKNKTSKTRLSTIVKYSFREITNAHCTINSEKALSMFTLEYQISPTGFTSMGWASEF